MSYENFTRWADSPASLDPELSVVIPAYNEAERIVPTIISIAAMLSEVTTDFEIILSDDGSSDDFGPRPPWWRRRERGGPRGAPRWSPPRCS